MIGQPSVLEQAKATLQRPIQPRFQSSSGHCHSKLADLASTATVA
jgi:hypothetical protein